MLTPLIMYWNVSVTAATNLSVYFKGWSLSCKRLQWLAFSWLIPAFTFIEGTAVNQRKPSSKLCWWRCLLSTVRKLCRLSGGGVHTQVWRSLREDAHSCSCKNKKRSLSAEEVEPRQWVQADSCESIVNSSTTLSFSGIGFGQSMMRHVRKTGFRSEMTGIICLSKG